MKKSELRHAKKIKDTSNDKVNLKNPHKDLVTAFSYYNQDAIITKNGELMQILKITGFNNEFTESETTNLRDILREVIFNRIEDSNYAIWLHTIRSKKNILPKGEYNNHGADLINQSWNKNNNWSDQYINELYLTIIISGQDAFNKNILSLFRSFSSKRTHKYHISHLDKQFNKLNETVANIMQDMTDFGIEKLSIYKENDIYYSAPMSFLSKIINFIDEKHELKVNSLDQDLTNCKMAFGNREMEVMIDEKEHFGAIFSVKEYNELSIESLDKFLQLPQEFIITQSLRFTDRSKALAKINYQNYVLEVSQDEDIKYLSGLSDEIISDNKRDVDFADQQITITLINDTNLELKRDIKTALSCLQKLGLSVIREELYLEHCFWSQLPANFKLLVRKNVISSSKFGGFASLHNFPAGSMTNNHWGNAITIFRTIIGTPYFFNFHHKDRGHTVIIGPNHSGKAAIMNFLLSETKKINNKLFYFNSHPESEIFIRAMNGNYFYPTNNLNNPELLRINPLKLENNAENKIFLEKWFNYLINYSDNIPKEERRKIGKVVEEILDKNIEKLSEAVILFKDIAPNIYQKLSIWHSNGHYSFIFDHEEENNLATNLINCFSFAKIIQKKALLIPIVTYLLHKIEISLDGSPTIIAIDKSMDIINNYAIAPILDDFLNRIAKKNCIVIFSIDSEKDIIDNYIQKTFHEDITTSIFLADSMLHDYYKSIFNLNEYEFKLINKLHNAKDYFLLKHEDISVVSDIDLDKIGKLKTLLSANENQRILMREAIKNNGRNSEKWIDEFLNKI
jgi:type IV secretion system protein VirB4